MKIHELFEARKNPDHPAQQKVSTFEQIYKYTKDNEHYVTFTQIPKVGVNPKSIHTETPNAVYAYPLFAPTIRNQFKDSFETFFIEDLSQIFPYANNAKYVNIMVATKPIQDVSNYTNEQWDADLQKILNITNITYEQIVNNFGKDLAYAKMPFEKLWLVTQKLSKSTNHWSNILINLGYNGFSDIKGTGLIHKAEPIQAFFLKPDAYKVVDMFRNEQEGMI